MVAPARSNLFAIFLTDPAGREVNVGVLLVLFSTCCGGGGLALFYEPTEEERIGVKRVQMAADAGANVIVTACPFCMVNIEDAIKVAGLEGRMTAIDLVELVDRQMAVRAPETAEQLEVMGAQGD